MNIFENYARYYDFLYQDKNYGAEANYIDALIKRYYPEAKSILELGCGTGNHAMFLIQKNYEVLGVDISEKMVEQANKKAQIFSDLKDKISFLCADIRNLNLDKKFDAVISLFHVISYQTTNLDLLKSFSVVKQHLKPGGIFIFDCWYGPAVLTNKPSVRVKRFEDERIQITRLAEPQINPNENYVDVNFQVYIHDKKSNRTEEFKEVHRMRYLFKPEIEILLNQNDLSLLSFEEWGSGKSAGSDSWGVCFVAKRI